MVSDNLNQILKNQNIDNLYLQEGSKKLDVANSKDMLKELSQDTQNKATSKLEFKTEDFKPQRNPELEKTVEYKPQNNVYAQKLDQLRTQEEERLTKLRNLEVLKELNQKNIEAGFKKEQTYSYKRVMDDTVMLNKPKNTFLDNDDVVTQMQKVEETLREAEVHEKVIDDVPLVQNNNIETKTDKFNKSKNFSQAANVKLNFDTSDQEQQEKKKKSLTQLMQDAQLEEMKDSHNKERPQHDDVIDFDDFADFEDSIAINNRKISNIRTKMTDEEMRYASAHKSKKNNKLRSKFKGV